MRARLARRVDDWPQPLLAAWKHAKSPPTSFYGVGSAAAKLSPRTLLACEDSMGQLFGYAERYGLLTQAVGSEFVTPALLEGFVGDLRARNVGNSSIRHRLADIARLLRLIDPLYDASFIIRPNGLSLRRALPDEPRDESVHDSREVHDVATALFREGVAGRGYAKGFVNIRDAALLGLFATRAPRAGACTKLRVQDLERVDGRYILSLPVTTSKNKKPLRYPLPHSLTEIFDAYLGHVRGELGGRRTDALWMSTQRRPMAQESVADVVRRRIMAAFGEVHGPQWLRKCLTTTAVMTDPAAAFDAATVLGHTPAVSLVHYNMATPVAALARHGDRVGRLQRETRALAARAFGWTK